MISLVGPPGTYGGKEISKKVLDLLLYNEIIDILFLFSI
jgi:hypothetical protein